MLAAEECPVCLAIETVRGQVVEAALADQYANPFWDDRYPEYGRLHSRKDNHYHLDFLITSLRLDTPATFYDYVAWLRPMIVMRGMCTRHIRLNLDSLAGHLQAALPDQWAQIAPAFAAGRQALLYQHPACQALSAAEEAIARAAAGRTWQENPVWAQKFGPDGFSRLLEYSLVNLAYLEDALNLDHPELFGKYLAWFSGFMERQGIAAAEIQAGLAALGGEIGRTLPETLARPFLDLLPKRITR